MSKKLTHPVVYLSGGLGNQLFQVASGLQLKSERITFNVSQIRGNFELNDFLGYLAQNRGIQVDVDTANPGKFFIATHNYILRSSQWKKSFFPKKLPIDIARFAMGIRNSFESPMFITDEPQIGDLIKGKGSEANLYFVGYFQTKEVAHEIVTELAWYLDSVSRDTVGNSQDQESIVIVHVRRGDYSSEDKIGMLSLSYFQNAIREITNDYKDLDVKVFSNGHVDLEALAIPHSIRGLTFVDSNSALDLLNKMRDGKIFIISNSTLSWWAAYLCSNPEKRVLYPDPWFRNLPKPVNLCPKTWEAFPAIWSGENEE
jgi:hypothetical protein